MLVSGVAPFPGATTGTGGRIRDVQATGRGAHVIAGTAGYSFGNLHIPGIFTTIASFVLQMYLNNFNLHYIGNGMFNKNATYYRYAQHDCNLRYTCL